MKQQVTEISNEQMSSALDHLNTANARLASFLGHLSKAGVEQGELYQETLVIQESLDDLISRIQPSILFQSRESVDATAPITTPTHD